MEENLFGDVDRIGFPYARDEYPERERKPLSEYVNIGTYSPPSDWTGLNRQHKPWMASMPPLVHKLVRDSGNKPLNIMTQMICTKNWAREQGVLTAAGLVAWVNFTAIDPCYVALDHEESYRLLTREEYESEASE